MLELKKFPEPILREQMPDFDFENPILDPKELEQKMLDFMYENNGIGLAANQVGLKARVFVMGHKDNPQLGQAFFNPQVIETTEEIMDLEEGCLSFPNIFVRIKRPSKIKAAWQNHKGEWQNGVFTGYDCKCFLHELDHLEGIVFKDRVSSLKWNMAAKKGSK